MQLCTFSGALVDPDRLDGNGVLYKPCPGCGRTVTAEPVQDPAGLWYLRTHKPPVNQPTYGWPTLTDLHTWGL